LRVTSRGLGDVYKRQLNRVPEENSKPLTNKNWLIHLVGDLRIFTHCEIPMDYLVSMKQITNLLNLINYFNILNINRTISDH
jgi:hypothetical protein